MAYPVPLATEASVDESFSLARGISEYVFGKPKRVLRKAENNYKEGLPDTEETAEYIQGYLWKKSKNMKTLKERKK